MKIACRSATVSSQYLSVEPSQTNWVVRVWKAWDPLLWQDHVSVSVICCFIVICERHGKLTFFVTLTYLHCFHNNVFLFAVFMNTFGPSQIHTRSKVMSLYILLQWYKVTKYNHSLSTVLEYNFEVYLLWVQFPVLLLLLHYISEANIALLLHCNYLKTLVTLQI